MPDVKLDFQAARGLATSAHQKPLDMGLLLLLLRFRSASGLQGTTRMVVASAVLHPVLSLLRRLMAPPATRLTTFPVLQINCDWRKLALQLPRLLLLLLLLLLLRHKAQGFQSSRAP